MKTGPKSPISIEGSSGDSNLSETLDSIIKGLGKNGSTVELDLADLESKTGKSEEEIKEALVKLGYVVNESSADKPDSKDNSKDKAKKIPKRTKQPDKTGWTDIDHKLEDAVNRLRNAKDQAEKDKILEELKALKEEKFPEVKPKKTPTTRTQRNNPTPTSKIDNSAYEDDYTPKKSNVEAVATAIEDKKNRDFIDEAAQHGAFESDYIPRERFEEQSSEVPPSSADSSGIPEKENKNALDDLIVSLKESGQSPEVSPSNTDGAGNTENLISHEEWQALIGKRKDSELHEDNLTPHDDFGFEESQPETFESELEVMIRKAKEPSTRIYTILSTILALARIQNNPGVFALTVERAHAILEKKNSALKVDPDNDIYNDLAKKELLEILEELKPAALEAERNSTSHKIQTLNHENGKTNFDVEPEPAVGMSPTSLIEPSVNPETPVITEEKASEAIKTIENRRGERLKKLGGKFIDGIQSIEKNYNSIPLKYRLGISATMLALSYGAGGAGAGINLGYRLVMTTISMVSLERLLASQIQGERTKWQKTRHVTEAVTLAILASFFSEIKSAVASGADQASAIRDLLSKTPELTDSTTMPKTTEVISNLTEEQSMANLEAMRALDNANSGTTEVATTAAEKVTSQTAPANAQAPQAVTEVARPTEIISSYTVASGDNLTKIIQEKVLANSGLEGAKLTNATENILSAMRADPTKFGITSGNLDLIRVGENIDIAKIKELTDSISINGKGIIETANSLTPEQVSNITNYKPSVAEVTTPNVGSVPNVSESIANPVNAWSGEGVGNEEVIEKIPDVEIKDAGTNTEATSNIAESSTDKTQKTINSELVEQVKFKADIELRQMVENKFGSKGIFGMFKSDGMNIWDNIKDTPIAKLENFEKVGSFEAGSAEAKSFLVQPSTRDTTIKIISELQEATGIKPTDKETIGKYVLRMIEDTKMKALTSTPKNLIA